MLRSWLRYNTIPSNCRVLLDALPTSRPLPLIEDSYKNTVSRAAYEFWRDQISEEQAIENNENRHYQRHLRPIEPGSKTEA